MNVRDHLFSLPATAASVGAITAIDGVQHMAPAEQIVGLACAFKFICERLHLDPREVLSVVGRMEDDCRFRNENTLNAVRAYIDNEIKEYIR